MHKNSFLQNKGIFLIASYVKNIFLFVRNKLSYDSHCIICCESLYLPTLKNEIKNKDYAK